MALAKSRPDSDVAARSIVTNRLFKAKRELVWEAWTRPEHINRWWGPNGFTTTVEIMEVKPGGRWNLLMVGPDGTKFPNKSLYVEVVKPERLSYDHLSSPHFRATATFVEREGGTEVTLDMVFATQAERDMTAEKFNAVEGAKQTFNRLGEFLAAHQ